MTIRLRNERFTFGCKRRPIKPFKYERVDENNIRIGCKWFKHTNKISWHNGVMEIINGVTIYNGNDKRFIANSFYEDIDINKL